LNEESSLGDGNLVRTSRDIMGWRKEMALMALYIAAAGWLHVRTIKF
jgi:hypothetical protein